MMVRFGNLKGCLVKIVIGWVGIIYGFCWKVNRILETGGRLYFYYSSFNKTELVFNGYGLLVFWKEVDGYLGRRSFYKIVFL